MTRQLTKNKLFVFGIPLMILLFMVWLTRSAIFLSNPTDLAFAVTMDLLITIPLVYFLLIRKTEIPKYTVVSVFIVCLLIGGFILPLEHQGLLSKVKMFAIPIFEIGVFSVVIWNTRKILKSFRTNGNKGDFYDGLVMACTEALPKRVGKVFATEIGVIYYTFFCNKKKELKENDYTYYKKSGIKMVIWVFIFLVIVETGVVHLLLEQWNATVAWVLTFLGLYTCLQVLSLLRSLDKRHISFDFEEEKLYLRYGFFNQTVIPFQQIESIEATKKSLPEDDKRFVKFSPLDMLDPHNLIIHLNGEQLLHKIYGIEKKYESIALYVDEKEQFVEAINGIVEAR